MAGKELRLLPQAGTTPVRLPETLVSAIVKR
jgi:hypothetical protein